MGDVYKHASAARFCLVREKKREKSCPRKPMTHENQWRDGIIGPPSHWSPFSLVTPSSANPNGPPSHWSPISLVPHLIGPPTHQSPISLVPQIAPMHHQGWGQFRNWNWNWCQFQFQFQELELQRNWIKGIGIGIGIDKEELKELIQFLFLIVNSFWFFAMFLAESLNKFDLKPFWIQLTRISLDRYYFVW